MFDKILPVIIALVALQFFIRYMNKRRRSREDNDRDFDYKKNIDRFLKMEDTSGYNSGDIPLAEEARRRLGNPDLISEIPDDKRDVRRGLNLIIDAVTQGVRIKSGKAVYGETRYRDPSVMFDEIVEVIKKHRIE